MKDFGEYSQKKKNLETSSKEKVLQKNKSN